MRSLLAALVLALLIPSQVLAGTTTITETASYGQPLEVSFVTETVGTVTVNVTWQPKPRVQYSLTVWHLTDPNDIYSYDRLCQVYEGSGSGQPVGDYTCSFADGPTGYWLARFMPEGGKTLATMTITTP